MLTLDYDVVIPTHGRRFDLQAIDSMDHQEIRPRSIIVVVDGRPRVAERLSVERPETRVLCLESQLGQAAARQRGIEVSEAEWIAFLDDDDLWSRSKQSAMAAYLAELPEVRQLACPLVKKGDWAEAARVYRSARPLLPRSRDRLLALVPEPLVWRLRHGLPRSVTDSPAGEGPRW